MKFSELNIIPPLQKALDKQDFVEATEIQEKAIPFANNGKDVLGTAQTGSGKTLAFALPILQRLYNKRVEGGIVEGKIKRKIEALIIAPTRELAIQIGETFAPYSTNVNMKHTVIFGGVNDFHQIKAIEKGVDILIATPGRLEDLVSQGVIKLSYVQILCLDEADRMLNMGFMPDIKKVMKRVPKERQTLFFSATMPKEIKKLADDLLHCNEEVIVNKVSAPAKNVNQQVFNVKPSHKRKLLQYLIKKQEFSSIIIFVRTMDDTEFVLDYVKSAGVSCDNIHKGRSNNARQKALKGLKDGTLKVLVATDIASRGLDVSDLSCVINFNIPLDPEDYIHRIGRTARAGKDGIAISFVTEKDNEKLEQIEKLIDKKIPVNSDVAYLDEYIQPGKILGYTNFDEDGKEKFKKKTRKSTGINGGKAKIGGNGKQKKHYGKKK